MDIQKLLDDHILLVHHLARQNISRFKNVGYDMDLEELTAVFFEVFMLAAQKWDEEQGKFTTYLTWACTNKVTAMLKKHFRHKGEANRVTYEHEMATASDEDDRESGLEIFGESDTAFGAMEIKQALAEEMKHISPFARLLIEYTLCPPEFIERELAAQEAKHELSLDMQGESYRRKSLNIGFVANCLLKTASSPSAKRFIRNAVNEAKSAVLRAAA